MSQTVLALPIVSAGFVTLQTAYNASVQEESDILLNVTPDPVIIQAQVAGDVLTCLNPTDGAILRVTDMPDTVTINGSLSVVDAFVNAGALSAVTLEETFTTGAGFVGGGIVSTGTVTYDNSLFIWSLMQESKTYRAAVAPGFAAFTLFNALARIENDGNFDLVQALTLNVGVTHARTTAGASTTAANNAVNFAPQIQTTVAGATMNRTNAVGLTVAPVFSTVAASTANLGTIRGVHCRNPAVAIFGSQAGVETLTAYLAVDVDALPFGGNVTKRALRSALAAASNTLMIENTGGAASDFGAGDLHFDDGAGVSLGATVAAPDVTILWDGPNDALAFDPASGEDLLFEFGVLGGLPTYLFEAETFGQSEINYTQIRFGFDRFAFGQTGTIGNQVGVFVAGNRTVEVPGGWSDFLLTQGGGLNLGAFAMSDVAAWTINSISLDNTAASVASLDTLVIGGMTTSNPGVTVTERSALRVTGRAKLRGSVQYPPISPAALVSGNNNDWAGLLTASPNNNGRFWARISGNVVTSVLTGIDATAVQDGDTFELTNVSANAIDISHQNAASAAANRIISPTGATYVLGADETVLIRYDATTARWRLLAGTGA